MKNFKVYLIYVRKKIQTEHGYRELCGGDVGGCVYISLIFRGIVFTKNKTTEKKIFWLHHGE